MMVIWRRQQAEPERYSSSKTSISSGSSKHRTPPHEPHHNFMRLASSDQDNMAAGTEYMIYLTSTALTKNVYKFVGINLYHWRL